MIDKLIPWILIGTITFYNCEDFTPWTRCGQRCLDVQDGIAIDIDAIGWECGDHVVIWSGGIRYDRVIRDSGPLSRYAVDWPGVGLIPIIGDVPGHTAWFPGLSARAVMVNVTLARARLEAER